MAPVASAGGPLTVRPAPSPPVGGGWGGGKGGDGQRDGVLSQTRSRRHILAGSVVSLGGGHGKGEGRGSKERGGAITHPRSHILLECDGRSPPFSLAVLDRRAVAPRPARGAHTQRACVRATRSEHTGVEGAHTVRGKRRVMRWLAPTRAGGRDRMRRRVPVRKAPEYPGRPGAHPAHCGWWRGVACVYGEGAWQARGVPRRDPQTQMGGADKGTDNVTERRSRRPPSTLQRQGVGGCHRRASAVVWEPPRTEDRRSRMGGLRHTNGRPQRRSGSREDRGGGRRGWWST